MNEEASNSLSRRTFAKAAIWSAPVIGLAVAAPAASASGQIEIILSPTISIAPSTVTGLQAVQYQLNVYNFGANDSVGTIVGHITKSPKFTGLSISGAGWTIDDSGADIVVTYIGVVAAGGAAIPATISGLWTPTTTTSTVISIVLENGTGGTTDNSYLTDNDTLHESLPTSFPGIHIDLNPDYSSGVHGTFDVSTLPFVLSSPTATLDWSTFDLDPSTPGVQQSVAIPSGTLVFDPVTHILTSTQPYSATDIFSWVANYTVQDSNGATSTSATITITTQP